MVNAFPGLVFHGERPQGIDRHNSDYAARFNVDPKTITRVRNMDLGAKAATPAHVLKKEERQELVAEIVEGKNNFTPEGVQKELFQKGHDVSTVTVVRDFSATGAKYKNRPLAPYVPKGPRGGMTGADIWKAFQDLGLVRQLKKHHDRVWRHHKWKADKKLVLIIDGASTHNVLKEELAKLPWIEVALWPGHSPDLNMIEHLWKAVKDLMKNMFKKDRSKTQSNIEFFNSVVLSTLNCWTKDMLDPYIEGYPKRLQKVIDAHGGDSKVLRALEDTSDDSSDEESA